MLDECWHMDAVPGPFTQSDMATRQERASLLERHGLLDGLTDAFDQPPGGVDRPVW
jgi:hypothetical protein